MTAIYPFTVSHSQPIPQPTDNLKIQFGDMQLVGYSAESTKLHPGGSLIITFYWHANRSNTENYTVFVHLLGAFNPATNGPLWAGHDSYPAETPTTTLYSGQIVADRRVLMLPTDTPSGAYTIEVGLYKLETGERLKRTDNGEDHVIIEGFTVEH
jgi:hypothetical protein